MPVFCNLIKRNNKFSSRYFQINVAMELEIKQNISLTNQQNSMLGMHSFLNIMSVLIAQIKILNNKTINKTGLHGDLDLCIKITEELSKGMKNKVTSDKIKQYESEILSHINKEMSQLIDRENDDEIDEGIENIKSIFNFLNDRVIERTKSEGPEEWAEFEIKDIRNDLINMAHAIEKNSHGAYRIVNNIAQKKDKDYLFCLEISRERNDLKLAIPVAFKDVIRDLFANARKYTNPGGSIHIGIYEGKEDITFIVEDNGIGIPPDEIEKVIEFGERGSNTKNRRTMGAGFGLTKAYLTTKKYAGRMWIKSILGKGTRIKINMPNSYSAKTF